MRSGKRERPVNKEQGVSKEGEKGRTFDQSKQLLQPAASSMRHEGRKGWIYTKRILIQSYIHVHRQ